MKDAYYEDLMDELYKKNSPLYDKAATAIHDLLLRNHELEMEMEFQPDEDELRFDR